MVLGPVGANFGAGMTGGRAYLYDPSGRHVAALDERSVGADPAARPPWPIGRTAETRVDELIGLLQAHRSAGSALAGRLLDEADLASRVLAGRAASRSSLGPMLAGAATRPQPRSFPFRRRRPTPAAATVGGTWGSVTSG